MVLDVRISIGSIHKVPMLLNRINTSILASIFFVSVRLDYRW